MKGAIDPAEISTPPPHPLDWAWGWYVAVRELARTARALGLGYWDELPSDHPTARHNHLRDITGADLTGWAASVVSLVAPDHTTTRLDEVAVLLLFTAFEGEVRERAGRDARAELAGLPEKSIVRETFGDLVDDIEKTNFGELLDFYKSRDSQLVGEVKLIRKYRNWLAHGRRGGHSHRPKPEFVHDRLRRFLDLLDADAPT